jgi:tricorn protease
LTDPYFAASSPAFDRKGEFLYYVSGREFSSPKYADFDTTFIYAGTDRIMMTPLRKDVKSPLAPRSDEEEIKPAKGGDKKNGDKKGDDKAKNRADGDKPLVIEVSGFESRSQQLPIPAGNYRNLAVNDSGKLLYVSAPTRGVEGKPAIRIFDVTDDKKEEQTVADGVGRFVMNAGGDKLLIQRNGRWQVIDAAAGGADKKPQEVSTGGLKTTIDPRAEWKQLFNDAWRIQRDYFYVKNMHGVDWPAIREQYAAMLDDAASREDVTYIIAEMISQLNIGHAYITSPGEIDQAETVPVGMLACDFELAKDGASGAMGYRFKKIYRGAPWDAEARGPLAVSEPEKDRIVEGEFLLAVNGVALDIGKDPYAAFIGLADKPAVLTVNIKPIADGGERHVLVTPVNPSTDQAIRFRAWIEANRAYVAKVTEGKVGYIYVPNTGVEGQNELFRQFFGQRDRAALIIDERWNGGGQIPTRFIELLNRPVTNYWANRSGMDTTWPPDGHYGPKCMLVNGQAGSGGDMFPWLFKSMKLGKVIGMRTWGGLVGISGNPQLIDGGAVSVPTFGFYKKDGTWGVEGHGVDPDIVVVDDPGKMIGGGPENDPQLAAAIAHMLEELKTNPYTRPPRPADPDRRGMGVPEQDR